MDELRSKIKQAVKGEVNSDEASRELFSHDASLFEVKPNLIVTPKDVEDIKSTIKLISDLKDKHPELSITPRSAGTDMSGAAIGESVVIDMTKHFNRIKDVTADSAHVEPGVYYRDFEKATLKKHAIMPSYPASRDLCTVGGMVANNAGGEKSLQYGKTEKFVTELKAVLADGNEYTIKPLNNDDLDKKIAQNDFEGKLYRQVFDLIREHYEEIKAAQPKVNKDSTGYHIWNVWDKETGVFDLTQILIGSQGTLGVITDIKFRLVPAPKNSGTLVIFLRNTKHLGGIINDVLAKKPATFEGFDNYTLMLSFKLFFNFHKRIGWPATLKLGIRLLPDALMLLRGIPKMILLVEFNGDSPDQVKEKVHEMRGQLKNYKHEALFEEDETEDKARKFWIMRRESFNLLRQKVKEKHTAPFIDDLVVPPEHLPEFLPKLRKIINKHKLLATVAGHFGDGNFHVIPLMKIEDPKERNKLEPAMKEVNELVLKYGGSLSGEHNDGMIRGPWLTQMYGKSMVDHFKKIKTIFDPENIFNPHKKTDADWDYSMDHIRSRF